MSTSIFDRFSQMAGAVLVFAEQEALRLGYSAIEPEHLLLGLLSLPDGLAVRVLRALGVECEHLRGAVMATIQAGDPGDSEIYLSSRAKRVLEFAASEMVQLGSDYIGTEHLLLGLFREEESYVSDLLRGQGITLEATRAEVVRLHAQGVTENAQLAGIASTLSAPADLDLLGDDSSDISQVGVMPSTGFVPFDSVQQQRQQQAAHLARSQQCARQLQGFVIGSIFGLLGVFIARWFSVPNSTWLSNLRSLASILNNIPVLNWQPVVGWSPLLVLAFFALACVILQSVSLPFNWYISFSAPRRYGLLQGRTRDWLVLRGKSLLFSILQVWLFIEVATLLIVIQPQAWWVWATLIQLLSSLLITRFASAWFFSLSNATEPLSDAELNRRFHALLMRLRISGCRAFVAKTGHRASIVNAYLVGWGRDCRVVLTDTLLQNFTYDEIEIFLALELAHLVHHTLWKRLLLNILPYLCLYYMAYLVLNLYVNSDAVSAKMPMIVSILVVLLVVNNLTKRYYHYQHYQADEFALQVTGNVQAFKDAMVRLTDTNLQVATSSRSAPHPTSHPTLVKRLQHADDFAARISNVA